jgi:chaperonin GroEL
MPKQIVSGETARLKLLAGINLIADAVKATLGPEGKNCIFERTQTYLPISSRDGVTVAEAVEASDPFEQIGVNLIKGVAREAVDSSGDGTTTATLLAQAIYAEGVKQITAGANAVSLKRGIEKATAYCLVRLKEMAIPVSGDMIRQVATISANNDEFLGGLIATAMKKAGDDGVVTVEISRKPESYLEMVDGLQFSTGFLSPSFVNSPERNECVLEDVSILTHERKLAGIKDFLPLLQQEIAGQGKSLLVIAEDVVDEALAILAINSERKVLKACAVKDPGGLDHLGDIAAMTGATVITELSGLKPRDFTLKHLGHARKVVVKAQSTTIIADSGENQVLNRRLAELRTRVTEAPDEAQKLRLQGRLARLAGGIAIIKVGAPTELEMNARKERIEDAMLAARCAQSEGVLVGGGIALLHSLDVSQLGLEGDELHGAEIVRKACFAPLRTLAENAGESADFIVKQVISGNSSHWGWNARTRTFEDLVQAGVLDPLRVVRIALESAASVAALALITATLIASERAK